jgi:hypothetical protein
MNRIKIQSSKKLGEHLQKEEGKKEGTKKVYLTKCIEILYFAKKFV